VVVLRAAMTFLQSGTADGDTFPAIDTPHYF